MVSRQSPIHPIQIIVASLLVVFAFSCNNKFKGDNSYLPQGARPGMDTARNRCLSWNILLRKGTNPVASIESVEQAVRDRFPSLTFRFDVFYCRCDSLLYNLAATAVDGSGTAIVPPPSPGGPPAPSGDIVYISNNNAIVDNDTAAVVLNEKPAELKNLGAVDPKNSNNILGILDTGLDTTMFHPSIRHLLWAPPAGKHQFNFVTGVLDDYRDNHNGKHGTVVTALALHQLLGIDTILPRIMVLKVLDGEKTGTTFTVSCGLSYAIKYQARIVNASLGYYQGDGKVDSIFRHYIQLATSLTPRPITIFAAAGNTSILDPHRLCDNAPPGNELTGTRRFYPAFFSHEFPNLITIAGTNNGDGVCRYQNFSSTYVNFGIKNMNNCCFYTVPMLRNPTAGSSFATPLASGLAMRARDVSIANFLQAQSTVVPAFNNVISGGKIILFDDGRSW